MDLISEDSTKRIPVRLSLVKNYLKTPYKPSKDTEVQTEPHKNIYAFSIVTIPWNYGCRQRAKKKHHAYA